MNAHTPPARRGRPPKGYTLAFGVCLLCALIAWIGASGAQAQGNGSTQAQKNGASLKPGAVFAMTNDRTNNEVVAFQRGADGLLNPAGTFSTGGQGSGTFENSANGLILGEQSPNNLNGGYKYLFATNAGSDTISVFRVKPDGLELVDQKPSQGDHPISVTVHDNTVYVLNGGTTNCTGGTPSIAGFKLGSDGQLTPIPGSTRPVIGQSESGCAQISFNPDGNVIVVSERTADSLTSYKVDKSTGLTEGPIRNETDEFGPFGITYTQRGQLLSAINNGAAPDQGGAASFKVNKEDGTLTQISPTVRNGRSDTCWIVDTDDGKFAFTTNFQSGDISSYRVNPDGTLELLDPSAAQVGEGASDESLSGDSHFLYARNSAQGTITAFRVEDDGTLVRLQDVPASPPGGQGIGIAVK